MTQIQNLKIAHVGEEVEEHQEIEATTEKTETQANEIIDIGPYFFVAVTGLAVIIFIIFKLFKKKNVNKEMPENK